MDLPVRKSTASLMVLDGGKSATARFEVLIRAHYRALYRTALRLTRSVHDAEDLVHEVCVRAFPRLDEIEKLERPHFWLVRVMYRVFIDSRRRYERRNVESMDTRMVEPFADEAGPAEEIDVLLLRERLDRAWRRLDDQQRALLALHDIEGYSLAELNEMMGIKEGTLKSRLHRARVRLGKLLEREQNVDASKVIGAVR
jgi:RNA polymerase sigma-70 factor (ECF subfamily)